MNVETTAEAGTTVVRVDGEVDMNSAPTLRDALRTAIDRGATTLHVHLGGVTYMDSAGIAVLIEGLQWCKRETVDYALTAMPHPVRVVVELARLDTDFTILPDAAPADDGGA
jgi:anti-sigma B factor antagonist